MNKTPKLRFNEFSEGWGSKKIGQTLKIKHGKDQKKVQVENGVYPILATGGEIGRTNTPLYDKESVLIGRKGTIDRPVYMNTPFWTVDTLFYSEIKEGMHPKFIYYKFQNINWKKYCEASGVPSLSASTIEGIKYNIPSIKEQEKIASFFSLIDNKISLQIKKVNFLKEYNNGIMQRIFSNELRFKNNDGKDYPEWEEKKLGELVIFTNGKAHENCIDECGEYIVVNSKFISSGGSVVKLSNENFCPLKKDDIVMVMSDVPNGKALAKCYLIDKDEKYTLNQRICGLRSRGADYKFLYYSINRNKYYLKFDNGVGQTNLRKDEVLECPILLPCKEEQEKIGSLLLDLDIKLEKEQEKLSSLNEYKKGLLQQMFV